MIRLLHEDNLVRVEFNPADKIVRILRTNVAGSVDLGVIERALSGVPNDARLLVDSRARDLDVGTLRKRFSRVAVLGKGGFSDEDAALDSLID
jgi:hypothetical protein